MRIGRAQRVPFVPQLESADCGAACLAMLLRYHGNHEPLPQVRSACNVSGGGTSALDLARAAQGFGLEVSAYKVSNLGERGTDRPVIAHCRRGHFVVVTHARRRALAVLDPASGPRRLATRDAGDELSGVILDMIPGPHFRSALPPSNDAPKYVREALLPSAAGIATAVALFFVSEALLTALPWLAGRWMQARAGSLPDSSTARLTNGLILASAAYALVYLVRDLHMHRVRERLELLLLRGASRAMLRARQQEPGDRSREDAATLVNQASSFERLTRALIPAGPDALALLLASWLVARESAALGWGLLFAQACALGVHALSTTYVGAARRRHDEALAWPAPGGDADPAVGRRAPTVSSAWARHRAAIDRGELAFSATCWLPRLVLLWFAARLPLAAALCCCFWHLLAESRVRRLSAIGPLWSAHQLSRDRLAEALNARSWDPSSHQQRCE